MDDGFEIGCALIGVLFVVAIVISLWPLFLIGGAIWLIWWLVKRNKKKEEERIAAEKREAEERERETQRQKNDISSQISMRITQASPDIRGLKNYISSVDPAFAEYARQEAMAYLDGVKNEVIIQSSEGDFEKAYAAADFLCFLKPDDEAFKAQLRSTKAMADMSSLAKCYIMSEQYAVPNLSLIRNMQSITPDVCRASMQERGPLFSLWYFAIARPFDPFSFSVAVKAAKKIKSKYFRVLIDPILACMYAERHQPGADIKAIYPEYLKDAYDFIRTTDDRRQLQAFASALSWIGETDLEQTCQVKLRRLNSQAVVA